MIMVVGELVELGQREQLRRRSGGEVAAIYNQTVVARVLIDSDGRFKMELPLGTLGEVEFRTDVFGAAPVVVNVGSDEVLVRIIVNRNNVSGY